MDGHQIRQQTSEFVGVTRRDGDGGAPTLVGPAVTGPVGPTVTVTLSERSPLLSQTEQFPNLVALVGIVALALFAGSLLVRNRLARQSSDPRSDDSDARALVTDRERIRRLVTENGGRMKQADIVDSVEWSKAKVSRLLADLEEDEEITKLRLGRENLICLRGHEPPASKTSDRSGSE